MLVRHHGQWKDNRWSITCFYLSFLLCCEIKCEMKSYGSSVTRWTAHIGDTDEIWPSTKSRIDRTSDARSFEIFSLEYCTYSLETIIFQFGPFLYVPWEFDISAIKAQGHESSWGFFIPNWGLPVATKMEPKGLKHLGKLPRQYIQTSIQYNQFSFQWNYYSKKSWDSWEDRGSLQCCMRISRRSCIQYVDPSQKKAN